MNATYQDPSHVGSFGGVDALYRAFQGKVSKNEIRKWLSGVDAYTLHKPARRKFPTNRVVVYSIDQQWQADLMDVSALQTYNDGYRYILICIDIFSKWAWAIPLKTKRGGEVVDAFRLILLSGRKPKSLQTDQGSEFKNFKFQKFLKDEGIRFFTTYNNGKASVAERLIRTIKGKMFKYFSLNRTCRYRNVLDQLIHSYNHTYHSSIRRPLPM